MSKKLIGILVGFSLLVPLVSQAAGLTSEQINAVVSLLQSFGADPSAVLKVQLVLSGQKPHEEEEMGSSTSRGPGMPSGQLGKLACIVLARNLRLGSQGDDVRKLQDLLAQDPENGFTASSTGFFGPLTAHAVITFQLRNGIASTTDGSVGPLTRKFFERRCGKGLGGGMPGNPQEQEFRVGSTSHPWPPPPPPPHPEDSNGDNSGPGNQNPTAGY
jgi:hypothetical protein